MLKELAIRNIVLIDTCDLTLAEGLCVLTGETGAGKSILLDALGLALGGRSEARLMRNGAAQASVSATFDIGDNKVAKGILAGLGLEIQNEIIVRRALTPDGKTRCFINDVAVSVTGLKSLGDTLIEIHGQHDGRGLLDPATHRVILDAYGELEPQVLQTQDAYGEWKRCQEAVLAARAAIEAAEREKEYLQHMQKELSTLAPEAGEEVTLADARTLMMQSEKLAETLNDARNELVNGKGAAGMLASSQRILTRSALGADGRFAGIIQMLERAGEEVAEAETQIEKLLEASQYNPAKLEQIEERLFGLRAAARKYNIPVDELAGLLAEVTGKLESLREGQHQLKALEQAQKEAQSEYRQAAEKLSAGRAKAAKRLEKAVADELASLKMAATIFKITLEKLPEDRFSPHGIDAVQFVAATNKGTALSPLHKIASGGELSRFMLAMKVALAKVKSTPTLIFDEIDTGTGGAVADAIGQRLAKLGNSQQILVVTHLAQVAARGAHHLRVLKEEKRGHTFTRVETLSPQARSEEVARMLAGETVTHEARKAADKLLQAAG
jgi:DNA repair protein RecN (Recombination protein N)